MGRRGPARTPSKILELHGETRSSRINRHEPRPGGTPRMPRDMTAGAKAVWRRVVRDYAPTGVLTAVDADVLRSYCETVVRLAVAERELAETGPLVHGARRGERVKNPLHQVVRDNVVLLRGLARELGFTPSARTGLVGGSSEQDDPVESFLGGRRSA